MIHWKNRTEKCLHWNCASVRRWIVKGKCYAWPTRCNLHNTNSLLNENRSHSNVVSSMKIDRPRRMDFVRFLVLCRRPKMISKQWNDIGDFVTVRFAVNWKLNCTTLAFLLNSVRSFGRNEIKWKNNTMWKCFELKVEDIFCFVYKIWLIHFCYR